MCDFEEESDSTRSVSGKVLNSIALENPFIIGGSADTSSSTKAKINNTLDFNKKTPNGRNINFGIRENSMASIANGIALTGLTPFASTFLSFSDYLKPGVRLSAMMDLPVIYIFSHDSISVGEDGPTHEPIEQLVALRSIPNLDVYRPGDANEVIGAYKSILINRKPAALILGRNKVRIEDSTSSKDVVKGAYIVKKEFNDLDGIIIATGEELELAIDVYNSLIEKGYNVRVVSMPCMEAFERESEEYRNEILPKNIKTFVIEASSSYSWYKYVKDDNYLFTIDTFGASGSRKDVLNKYGFTKENISSKIENILK
jgi:transketolase